MEYIQIKRNYLTLQMRLGQGLVCHRLPTQTTLTEWGRYIQTKCTRTSFSCIITPTVNKLRLYKKELNIVS